MMSTPAKSPDWDQQLPPHKLKLQRQLGMQYVFDFQVLVGLQNYG
jgi:hypothetical protein